MNDAMTSMLLSQPFVSQRWLDEHRTQVIVADTRWYLDGSSGSAAYQTGFIPGAVFVDLDAWLSGPASSARGRNPLPDPAMFAEGMRRAGISDDDLVVAYDDAGGVIAARLVWMLRSLGHQAVVLDGGINNYPGPLEAAVPENQAGDFTALPWPSELLADIEETASNGALVVDARNRDRFEGRHDPIDPRPGHIPGAVNVPCRENLEPDGTLSDPGKLMGHFRAAGIESASNVISYCGSGVTACHNLLVMEHLGMGSGRLFVGGWSQYGHASHLPVETGSLRRGGRV